MKCLNYLFVFLFVPASLFAQYQVIDWETVGQDWTWTIFANGPNQDSTDYTVVANPDPSGINTSAHCGKLLVRPEGDPWAGIYSDNIVTFTLNSSNCHPTIMVYKDKISDFNLKLEGPSLHQDVRVPNTVTNQWQLLTFDYTAYIGQVVNRLTIMPDFQDPRTSGGTCYFDNVDFGTTVPVELTSFTAEYVGNTTRLNWTTATELNNLGFDIQRSTDENDFVTIGFVLGKGTTTEIQNYSYVDKTTSPNVSYNYRLRMNDFNGNVHYSDIINLGESNPLHFQLNQNYPNPFNPTTTINLGLPVKSNVTLDVYNIVGEKVLSLYSGELAAGNYNYAVDASHLPSGIYVYVLNAVGEDGHNSTLSRKMTLLK